jgi:hypothetical protein
MGDNKMATEGISSGLPKFGFNTDTPSAKRNGSASGDTEDFTETLIRMEKSGLNGPESDSVSFRRESE